MRSSSETVEKVPKQILGGNAEKNDFTECATINDLTIIRGHETPRNYLLTVLKGFSTVSPERVIFQFSLTMRHCKRKSTNDPPLYQNLISRLNITLGPWMKGRLLSGLLARVESFCNECLTASGSIFLVTTPTLVFKLKVYFFCKVKISWLFCNRTE